jgi:pimeloyl-ACP methyl ester carboxylesterase
MEVEPLPIDPDEAGIADLRRRIADTRFPESAPGDPWSHGTDPAALRSLLDDWSRFSWPPPELAARPHFRADLDGLGVHFVHLPSGGVPLILTHGWPSTFAEMLPLVPLLDDFDLVIPSLPGYGFSDAPGGPHTTRDTARLWHRLMQGLGYDRYGAHGTDFGAAVSTFMAIQDPDRMIGLHLTNMDNTPYLGHRVLSEAERAYQRDVAAWDEVERGYSAIQSTRPLTVAYGLTDSPAGLAAWVAEKWVRWSDSGGDLARVPRAVLLTVLTTFWLTRTIGSSMRDYLHNRWSNPPIGPEELAAVPTALAIFDHAHAYEGTPPREWAERLYDVRRYTRMPRGGHFAAAEAPQLVADDLRAFFTELA